MPSVADPGGGAGVHLTAAITGTDGAPVAPLSALAVEGELVVGAQQGLPAHRALEPVLIVVDATGVVVGGTPGGTALGNLEISALGLESLRIGDAPPATPSAGDIVVWDDARCDDGGRWVPAYADRPGADGVVREPFEIWTSNGVISQIAVRTPGPRTPAGIQVGDTLTSLVATYPGLDHFNHHRPANEPEIWAIGNQESLLLFEVGPTEPGSGWDPALTGRILAMSAVDTTLPFQLASGIDTCTAPSPFVELR